MQKKKIIATAAGFAIAVILLFLMAGGRGHSRPDKLIFIVNPAFSNGVFTGDYLATVSNKSSSELMLLGGSELFVTEYSGNHGRKMVDTNAATRPQFFLLPRQKLNLSVRIPREAGRFRLGVQFIVLGSRAQNYTKIDNFSSGWAPQWVSQSLNEAIKASVKKDAMTLKPEYFWSEEFRVGRDINTNSPTAPEN